MACHQRDRLIGLHKKAAWHSNEYKRLLRDCGVQSKARGHLQKAERLCSQVSGLLGDFTSTPPDIVRDPQDSGLSEHQNRRTDSWSKNDSYHRDWQSTEIQESTCHRAHTATSPQNKATVPRIYCIDLIPFPSHLSFSLAGLI